jgi:hypothetical protein
VWILASVVIVVSIVATIAIIVKCRKRNDYETI